MRPDTVIVASLKPHVRKSQSPPETVGGATMAALRYVSPLTWHPHPVVQVGLCHFPIERILGPLASS
jgi:hypothetical protein